MESKIVKAILKAIETGDRVIIIPVKDGIAVYRIKREKIE